MQLDTLNQIYKSDQLFKVAIEQSPNHIIITDENGKIMYANTAAEHMTGYSLEEMRGNTPSLWGKLMPSEFYSDMWEIIKVQKKVFRGEITNQRKNGEKYSAIINISPLTVSDELIGFIGVEQDITQEKKIDRMKTEFISLASHQLRTPLSAIKWLLELLIGGNIGALTEPQLKYLNNINISNERMITLVNDLLNISRIETGKLGVELYNTKPSEIIDDVLALLQKKIIDKKLHIEKRIENSDISIMLDGKLFREIVLNLCTNSVKYNKENGTITVDLQYEDNSIVLKVGDTGYGIPDEEKSRVYEKFFRGKNIYKIETDGTGLGLYLVKSIVYEMKGTIQFDSQENKGTVFTVCIPLEKKP